MQRSFLYKEYEETLERRRSYRRRTVLFQDIPIRVKKMPAKVNIKYLEETRKFRLSFHLDMMTLMHYNPVPEKLQMIYWEGMLEFHNVVGAVEVLRFLLNILYPNKSLEKYCYMLTGPKLREFRQEALKLISQLRSDFPDCYVPEIPSYILHCFGGPRFERLAYMLSTVTLVVQARRDADSEINVAASFWDPAQRNEKWQFSNRTATDSLEEKKLILRHALNVCKNFKKVEPKKENNVKLELEEVNIKSEVRPQMKNVRKKRRYRRSRC